MSSVDCNCAGCGGETKNIRKLQGDIFCPICAEIKGNAGFYVRVQEIHVNSVFVPIQNARTALQAIRVVEEEEGENIAHFTVDEGLEYIGEAKSKKWSVENTDRNIIYDPMVKKVGLRCACCDCDAGTWQQWWNQDCGYGVCPSCVKWMLESGETEKYIKDCFGHEDVNWGATKA